MMKRFGTFFMVAVMFLLSTTTLKAQNVAVKTNALYWATASFNIGVEAKMSSKWTASLSAGYNPFTFSDNKKLKHILVQPEVRYWFCSPFAGHFVGVNGFYSHYNAGGVNLPFGIYSDLEKYRYQGDIGAIGVLYGYSWMLNKRWSIEGVIGIGYGITHYDKYECVICGSKLGKDTKSMVMPTKIAVSVVYNID